MSIAVRVSVWILGLLVVISAAVAVLALMQKQSLQGQNQYLRNQISDYQSKLANLASQTKKIQDDEEELNNKVTQAQQEKSQIQTQYDDLKHKSDDLQAQIQQANSDRDDWKNRVDTISRERDDLMQKLKSRPTQIVYKERIVQSAPSPEESNLSPTTTPEIPSAQASSGGQDDQYWANVLKQKAALLIEIQKEKTALDQAALQVVDLKKENSDLEVELKRVTNEKDEIVQKIKYGQDLADNLSIDLARSHNDEQAINQRADKLKEENLQLLGQIKELSSTKLELEKTVSRLTDDKETMQKRLIETESVIQSRIDDIWKIKSSLDKKLSENSEPMSSSSASSSANSVDLPPIIVNSPNNNQMSDGTGSGSMSSSGGGKNEGSVISINESNNFVIVDLGQENSSVSVGNSLKVYRNSNEIATLQVIQVRRDICAADIKNKSNTLKVGDIVKLGA